MKAKETWVDVKDVGLMIGGAGNLRMKLGTGKADVDTVIIDGSEENIVGLCKVVLRQCKEIAAACVMGEFKAVNIGNKAYVSGQHYIPSRMMPAIKRYVEEHRIPGDFLQAVICNDLVEAFAKADDENARNLRAFVSYFYNEVPSPCWGSKKKMRDWLAEKPRGWEQEFD